MIAYTAGPIAVARDPLTFMSLDVTIVANLRLFRRLLRSYHAPQSIFHRWTFARIVGVLNAQRTSMRWLTDIDKVKFTPTRLNVATISPCQRAFLGPDYTRLTSEISQTPFNVKRSASCQRKKDASNSNYTLLNITRFGFPATCGSKNPVRMVDATISPGGLDVENHRNHFIAHRHANHAYTSD